MTPRLRTRTETAASGYRFRLLLQALIALGCFAATASAPAQAAPILGILDYQGFVYESTPAGTPGSVLSGVGTVDTWFFPNHDPQMYYTWCMTGLVGQPVVDIGGGSEFIEYAGGTFMVFEDSQNNVSYDAIPGNGTADPAGFEDGSPWLVCEFSDFQLYWSPADGLGSFSGDLNIIGGSAAPLFAASTAYTFGGTTSRTLLPEGYPRKVDGAIEGPMVPEPSSLMLMGLPIIGWAGLRFRGGKRAKR